MSTTIDFERIALVTAIAAQESKRSADSERERLHGERIAAKMRAVDSRYAQAKTNALGQQIAGLIGLGLEAGAAVAPLFGVSEAVAEIGIRLGSAASTIAGGLFGAAAAGDGRRAGREDVAGERLAARGEDVTADIEGERDRIRLRFEQALRGQEKVQRIVSSANA